MFRRPHITEPELPGYAHATKANLYDTIKWLKWHPKIKLTDWLPAQLI